MGATLSGWPVVARELRRIARIAPRNYSDRSVQSVSEAQFDVETHMNQLHWEKVYFTGKKSTISVNASTVISPKT
jgi:hypothetical protein